MTELEELGMYKELYRQELKKNDILTKLLSTGTETCDVTIEITQETIDEARQGFWNSLRRTPPPSYPYPECEVIMFRSSIPKTKK